MITTVALKLTVERGKAFERETPIKWRLKILQWICWRKISFDNYVSTPKQDQATLCVFIKISLKEISCRKYSVKGPAIEWLMSYLLYNVQKETWALFIEKKLHKEYGLA